MNIIVTALVLGLLLLAIVFAPALARKCQGKGLVGACNIAEGTHGYNITRKASAAIATRHLLVKPTANKGEIAVNGAADQPLGVCNDEAPASGSLVNVNVLGLHPGTLLVVASEAIGLDDEIYTAANGKVQDLPGTSGTYYKIGRPITTAAADGDLIEIVPCYPLKVTV